MIADPIYHTSRLGAGRSVTVEWEPRAEWHSRWVTAHNVTGRRTVLARHATFTEARAAAARAAIARRKDIHA